MSDPAVEHFGEAGTRLWSTVTASFALDAHECELMRQACEVADVIGELMRLVAEEGLMSATTQGPRVHPALVEARAQRVVLLRLLRTLDVPVEVAPPASMARPGGAS
jgi:hypothetical protein